MLYEPNLMLVHPNFLFAERETLFGGSQNRATLSTSLVIGQSLPSDFGCGRGVSGGDV